MGRPRKGLLVEGQAWVLVSVSAFKRCNGPRQVSAVSGDVRRSLELCRRAAEMAETEHRCKPYTLKRLTSHFLILQLPGGVTGREDVVHLLRARHVASE